MSDKTELNLDAERASFEAAMNAARFFPAELCFARTKSPSGRDEYANSHLQSCWVGWLAARRATIQPTAGAPVAYMCPRDPDVASAFKWAVKGVDYSGLSCECGEKHVAVFVVAPADAVRDAERLDKFIDWYLRGGTRREVHEHGHAQQTTREHILSWLDTSTPKEPE